MKTGLIQTLFIFSHWKAPNNLEHHQVLIRLCRCNREMTVAQVLLQLQSIDGQFSGLLKKKKKKKHNGKKTQNPSKKHLRIFEFSCYLFDTGPYYSIFPFCFPVPLVVKLKSSQFTGE